MRLLVTVWKLHKFTSRLYNEKVLLSGKKGSRATSRRCSTRRAEAFSSEWSFSSVWKPRGGLARVAVGA